jgi:TetR/AcrR family transcriptional regulator, copper-responsive repressor
MESLSKRSGGRPRGFDRDAALDTAMRLFWKHGYEGVSFQQLTAALGVAAPSLYIAFGNKAALYREALDRYADLRGASDLSFMDEASSLREAVRLLLDGTARGLLDPKGEIGCMLNTGMIASHPDHADLAHELAQRRAAFRTLLTDKLVRWLEPSQADDVARFIVAVMQGLAIQARDGYSLDQLCCVAVQACQAMPDCSSRDPG